MRRRFLSALTALGVAGFAAACAEMPSATYAPAPAPHPPVREQALRPWTPPPAAPAPADGSNLVGRSNREVADLLGPPHLKRRDPPAELWQYRAEPCILDVFLYSDGAGGDFTVTHVEMRAGESPRALNDAPLSGRANKTEASRAECFRALKASSGRG